MCRVCLQDQHDVIERHTQSGLDLLDRYVKFVKERAEVEQTYAKLLRQETALCVYAVDQGFPAVQF